MNFFRIRREGRRLARDIRQSIEINSTEWVLGDPTWRGQTVLSSGDYTVTLSPRKCCGCRLMDVVRLSYKGNDVWLPLIARIRLRNTVRLAALLRAAAGRKCHCS